MKNFNFGVAIIFLFLISCDKKSEVLPATQANEIEEVQVRTKNTSNPTLQSGRLVFNNEEAFELKINELETTDLDLWETSLNFTSMRNLFLATLSEEEKDILEEYPIDDPATMAVLNAYGVVQINPWIFKLNAVTRQVFVLPVAKASKADLLQQEVPNDPDIQVFSFDDEVFDLLEGGAKASCECGPNNESSISNDGWFNYCEKTVNGTEYKHKFKCVSAYQGWGIIKSLKVKFFHRRRNSNGFNSTWHTLYFIANWERKCAALGAATQAFPPFDPTIGRYQLDMFDKTTIKTLYKGTRCLSRYRVDGLGGFYEDMCDAPTAITQRAFSVPKLDYFW